MEEKEKIAEIEEKIKITVKMVGNCVDVLKNGINHVKLK